MTPADKRMLDLLDRWLVSIELHLNYLDLDEASYRRVQPWPEHDRPNRWVLELAQQKALQLKTLCKSHIATNDPSFAESLELMSFLANLVGVQNIKRFVPLADPAREQRIELSSDNEVTQEAPKSHATAARDDHATREMPKLKLATVPTVNNEVERTREMPRLKTAPRKPAAAAAHPLKRPQSKPVSSSSSAPVSTSSARVQEIVVADAIRLLKWGREWHELTELIARMAERPSASEIRRILRNNKSAIEAQLHG